MDEIKVYTKEEFLQSTEPYEYLYTFIDDKFSLERELIKISEMAKEVGIRNFKTLFKGYCDLQKKNRITDYAENVTNFEGQPLELNSGQWLADDYCISREGPFGEVIACVHPIMPIRRLVNLDTGIEKLELAYRKGRNWRKVICDKKQLASSNSIVGLADYGIAVTSENAKHLVTYLHDVENLNYETIPENNSVSRLGWIGEEGFSPYVENLIFDGDISFKHYFESVGPKGDYDKWLDLAKEIRKAGGPARIILSASFASALVEPCGGLPFFVHLWGGTETGKTVGLMLAASVWANPEMGKYIHTFNSTAVAQELSAGFVNSMPLILDELQIVKDKRDFDNMIYQLTEGVGRNRGQKTGGLQRLNTWSNCILTTGEQPILTGSSQAGAVNRIIEINCEETKLFNDPIGVVDTIRDNYGYAGKEFVTHLQNPKIMEAAKELQKKAYKEIVKGDTTEKQAISASLILAADAIAGMTIFKDKNYMNYSDITKYLSSLAEVSASERAYSFLFEWIAQNSNKFEENDFEMWGRNEGRTVCIIRNIFDKALSENGFNPTSFLHWLRRNNHIDTPEKGFTKSKRIGGIPCHCVVLKVVSDDIPEGFQEAFDDEPF